MFKTKTDSSGNTAFTETNTWSAETDATYSNGGSTESASREASHPRDVTNDGGGQGAQTNECARAPSHETETLTQALTDTTVYWDTHCYFTESQNVAPLRKALTGDARKNVKSLLYSGTSADEILNSLQSKIVNCVASIKALKKPQDLYSLELVNKIVDKLNLYMKYKWFEFNSRCNQNEPDILKISRFPQEMNDQCGHMNPCETRKENRFIKRNDFKRRPRNATAIRHDSDIDSDNESSGRESRLQTIAITRPCGEDGCKKIHHKLLHQYCSPIDETNGQISSINELHKKERVFIKIIPVEIPGPLDRFETYALLGEGSTTTHIERDVVLKIATPGKGETLRIEGVGDKRLDYDKSFCLKIKIKGKFSRNIETMNAVVIDKLQLAPQTIDLDTVCQHSHLHELEDELCYKEARPTTLIGQDNSHLIVSRQVVQKNRDQPAASYTKLGWVVHGRENGIARPPTYSEKDMPNPPRARPRYLECDIYHTRSLPPEGPFQTSKRTSRTKSEINDIHKAAAFQLRGWASNEPDALVATESLRKEQKALSIGDHTERTLGVTWKMNNDTLNFSLNFRNYPREVIQGYRPPTTREVTSAVMSVFVPMGFAASITVLGQILMPFKPFVAHRLAEFEEMSRAKNGRWGPSEDKVADDATRGPPNEFSSEHRWFKGPKCLLNNSSDWPVN
ncbi:hypothetical protein EVAR_35701_1 [Eumeta japonica]|uniref:Uncharacterized protein n=1 Tax=Eumeta variegata TaxID=151549 RepID=A0A4C1VDR4_EUMVA|nr:hypothetical protein EVAR_35701_1 [Eumeta japonica]